jgi:hypothetical protein
MARSQWLVREYNSSAGARLTYATLRVKLGGFKTGPNAHKELRSRFGVYIVAELTTPAQPKVVILSHELAISTPV